MGQRIDRGTLANEFNTRNRDEDRGGWRLESRQSPVFDAVITVARLVVVVTILSIFRLAAAVMMMWQEIVEADVKIGCGLEAQHPQHAGERRNAAPALVSQTFHARTVHATLGS